MMVVANKPYRDSQGAQVSTLEILIDGYKMGFVEQRRLAGNISSRTVCSVTGECVDGMNLDWLKQQSRPQFAI